MSHRWDCPSRWEAERQGERVRALIDQLKAKQLAAGQYSVERASLAAEVEAIVWGKCAGMVEVALLVPLGAAPDAPNKT